MTTLDPPDVSLTAKANVPSRVDSVPAARAFLVKLLHGWEIDPSVIDDAALLTTEIMANALDHGDGLVSMSVALQAGNLHVAVQDNSESRSPRVLDAADTDDGGRGMWIVDIVSRDWGTESLGAAGGKTVWFDLLASSPPDAGNETTGNETGGNETASASPPGAPARISVPRQIQTLGPSDPRGIQALLNGTPVVVYQDKLSALMGDFARTLLSDFSIEEILNQFLRRIVDALPVTAAGLTLTSSDPDVDTYAASDDATLAFERAQRDHGIGPGITARESGAIVSVLDVQHDNRFPLFAMQAQQVGVLGAFAFPVHQNDGRLGALTLYRATAGPLSAQDCATAQTLADLAAAYVVNAHARAEVLATSDHSSDGTLRDELTGLTNRLSLHQRLARAADRARLSRLDVAVFFVDIDRFKQVNDSYGRAVGDQLLIAVARRLSTLLGPGDTLARVSGDEFVFLCEDLRHSAAAEALADRIVQSFTQPFVLGEVELTVTSSVGLAYCNPGMAATPQLIVNADIAMYQAKRNGGARRQLIDVEAAHRSDDRSGLEQDLHGAFARRELVLAYQPIVRSHDGLVIGAEALLRWTHPRRGPVSPLEIVGVAEDNGLIVQLGAWILEEACTQQQRWQLAGHPLEMSVNVSARQLFTPGFASMVEDVLARTGTPPSSLVLELTEGLFIREVAEAMSVLSDLQQLGCRLALDDFGTGYSSLSYLRHHPVDILKIDQSFVPEIETDAKVAAIAEAITRLAHVLELTVIAEGVESQAQRDQIVEIGCDFAQGYYFARPMTPAHFTALLGDGREPAYLKPPR